MTDQPPRQGDILDDDTISARDALSTNLASLWWTFLLRGVLAGLVGIAALFWPTSSIALLLRLVGVLLILDGALTWFGFGRRGLIGGFGIGAALIGLILLIWPQGVAWLAFTLMGAMALFVAIGSLMALPQMHPQDPERATVRNSGIFALIVGLILIFWPGSGMVALGWAIAFFALTSAVVMFFLAARFKKAGDRLGMRTINQ
ncbi:MAG: HdeD family acid-resistance protein [Ruegeria sp.]